MNGSLCPLKDSVQICTEFPGTLELDYCTEISASFFHSVATSCF